MELFQKIKQIYPEIENECFYDIIRLVKPDNREAFIEKWEHPTLPRPTQEQLDAIE